MIYTTYFANLGKLPPDVVPISIARKNPIGWKRKSYKRLAPPYEILSWYKATGDESTYRRHYERDVLGRLDVEKAYNYLHDILAGGKDFTLVCYERPEKFCHRHIVADWFKRNGYECEEWRNNE